MSPRIIRDGRATGRLRGVGEDPNLKRRCPRCDAAPGWRCVQKRKWDTVTLKNVHPERKVKN